MAPKDQQACWDEMVLYFEDLASHSSWSHVQPLAELTRELRKHPVVSLAYAVQSHEALCLDVTPGYDPEAPFLSVTPKVKGKAVISVWERVGKLQSEQACVWPRALELVELAWRELQASAVESSKRGG